MGSWWRPAARGSKSKPLACVLCLLVNLRLYFVIYCAKVFEGVKGGTFLKKFPLKNYFTSSSSILSAKCAVALRTCARVAFSMQMRSLRAPVGVAIPI